MEILATEKSWRIRQKRIKCLMSVWFQFFRPKQFKIKLSLLEGWLMRTDPEKAVFIAVKKLEQFVSIHKTLPWIKKGLLERRYTLKSIFS